MLPQLLLPENAPMRAALIGAGGLLGYTMGAIRGRLFRKLSYTGMGVAAASAACYPREAKELSSEALEDAKCIGNIAVNFVTGAQPGTASDAQLLNRGFAFARVFRLGRRLFGDAEKSSMPMEVFTSTSNRDADNLSYAYPTIKHESKPSYAIVRDDGKELRKDKI